jgi:FMN phosphatase YigB (HAD superfamily)
MNLILFDIDNTLLDTPSYADAAFARMRQILGMSESELSQKKDAFYQTLHETTDFTPQSFIDFLHISTQEQRAQLLECWQDVSVLKECLFADFTRNLERFRASSVLGIFSQGDLKFQLQKLQLIGLYSYFEQKYMFIKNRKVSPESLRELREIELDSFQKVIVIDDKAVYLEPFRQWPKYQTLLIDRKMIDRKMIDRKNDSATQQNQPKQIKVISSLDEVQL